MAETDQEGRQQARQALFEGALCTSVEEGAAVSPRDAQDAAPKASARAVTLNLITGGFGIGMFSLPWSLAGASLLPGVLTILLVVLVNAWTVSILIAAAEKHQAFDLGSLLSYLPGRASGPAQILTNAAVWLVLFVSQVGYVIVMAGAVTSVAGDTVFKDRSAAVALVSAAVLPLCFLDQRYLSFTSGFSVLVNLFVFAVISGQPRKPAGLCYVGAGLGTLSMISVMMQSIVVQMCVLPMYQELECRTPAKFRQVVRHSFGALSIIFVAFAVMGYVTYGEGVGSNILDALPDNAWGNAARVAAGLSVAGVYPIFEQAMVAPIWNMQGLRHRRPLYTLATVVTVSLILLVALFVTSIGFLNVLNGAFCSIIFVGLCPSLVGLQLLERRSCAWRAGMYALLALGTLSGILGMIFTDNYSKDLMRSCGWRSS
mmetsp:Transcript_73427/g.192536  ORF Transcript_73427/g.192536 Transcript_73427/m.192536 type:complete len:429 (-) Transcript_73427:71-1357(-)